MKTFHVQIKLIYGAQKVYDMLLYSMERKKIQNTIFDVSLDT